MVEIKLWTWTTDCWQCDTSTTVAWASDTDETTPISIDDIGKSLAEHSATNIERVYSKTRGQKVWGNICTSCDVYQGNHFIRKGFLDIVYTQEPDETIDINATCLDCDNEADLYTYGHFFCEDCHGP